MSVYSSTEQINLLKNIFTPEFQFGQGGFFQPTVKTYLPGNVEIGDPTTSYSLTLNGNSLASDLTVANWSTNPAVSTLSMAFSSITDVSSIQLVGGNTLTRGYGLINNLSGVQTLNGFALTISSAVMFGTDTIRLGASAGVGRTVLVSNVVAIGLRAGANNVSSDMVAIGADAGFGNSGTSNVVIGASAGFNSVGSANIFVGPNAGNGMTNVGGNNVAVGFFAGMNTNGTDCVMLGTNAGAFSGSATRYSVALGYNACKYGGGDYRVGIGFNTNLRATADYVVSIGYNAGASNSGTNCIFLGSNVATGIIGNTAPNTFLVYSTKGNGIPFLQGDMSANILGIGKAPVSGFGLAVQGSIQNTLNISTVTISPLILTPANAATRFFVSAAVTLSFASTVTQTGTHWIVTNTTSSPVTAGLSGGTVFGSAAAVTLPATSGGLGRGITFTYTGTGSNYYAF